MALQYGFFNSLRGTDGKFDRLANANDFANYLKSIFKTGVRRSELDDLKPSLSSNTQTVTFNTGFAFIEGRFAYNDSEYTVNVQAQPVGDQNRQDIIVLRLNTNTANRDITFHYIKGQEVATSTSGVGVNFPEIKNVITRSGGIYDIALCAVNFVKAGSSYSIYISDLRSNEDVCGWIRPAIDDNGYLESLDNTFNEWFQEKKDTLATTTLFKRYHQHLTASGEINQIQFTITQYDPSGVDIIDVYVNGILAIVDIDYTIEGSNLIQFTTNKIAGTEIDVYVYKSIDGTGLGSVSDEVTELQNQMATIKNIGEYIYVCNGVDDNVQISNLVQNMFIDGERNKQAVLSIYGNLGMTGAANGSGTAVSAYRYFDLTLKGTGNRVILDFAGCRKVDFDILNTTNSIGFYGSNIIIKNGNFNVRTGATMGAFRMFSATTSAVEADNCRFIMDGNCYISATGTFNNCYGIVTKSQMAEEEDTSLFRPIINSLLRINGGEYLVYGKMSSTAENYIINAQGACAIICNNVNAPSAAKSGYYQGQFFKNNSNSTAYATFNDCITTLSFDLADSAKIKVNNKMPFNFTNR